MRQPVSTRMTSPAERICSPSAPCGREVADPNDTMLKVDPLSAPGSMLLVDETGDLGAGDAGRDHVANLALDLQRDVHRILDRGNLCRRFDRAKGVEHAAAVDKPCRPHLACKGVVEAEFDCVIECKDAGWRDQSGNECGAALVFLPAQDVARQMREAFHAAAFEARNDVGKPVFGDKRAKQPLAWLPDKAGEVAKAFNRAKEGCRDAT